jgi:predicted  nucleic acid-binding Zn-ribbon protein
VHIVTKFLIVFVAIMGLIVSALTMAFAANASAIRSSFNEERTRRTQADANYNALVQQSAQEKATAGERSKAVEAALNEARSAIATLQAERTDLRSKLESAQADAASIRNQISQLGATTDTQAALIKAYREEAGGLRNDLFTARKKEVELLDRINDLESAREVLEQNARALKEQLEETRVQLQTAQQSGGAASGVAVTTTASQARELAGPLVRARVTETFKSPAGDDMVVIDQGANRGLKADTLMNVVRGDRFVASIVIVTAEPNRSVGRVTLASRDSGTISSGDSVLSRLD